MAVEDETSLQSRVQGLFAADPKLLADPFPTWNELRTQHPVWRLPEAVVLSRHEDVKELLADNNVRYSRAQTRHSQRYEEARQRFSPEGRKAFDAVLDQEFQQLVRLDPPDHPRIKQLVQPPFAVRSLKEEMADKVRLRVDNGLNELASQSGAVDFKRFAYTLPLTVLGDLLGIPFDDLEQIHEWAKKIAENKFNADSEEAALEASEAYGGLLKYIQTLLVRQESAGTTTGLIAALIESERSGAMNHDEVKAMVALMIFAGHETTSNLLTIGMLSLLRNRTEWDRLVAEPDLAPKAVEELLRFVTPAHFLPYVAAETREIGGVTIQKGETVIGVLAAANRDPDVFENPDSLDILRKDSRLHVGFGMGAHSCLGAGLARMEAVALFREMALRFPNAELADDELVWGGRSLRTPLALPLHLHGK